MSSFARLTAPLPDTPDTSPRANDGDLSKSSSSSATNSSNGGFFKRMMPSFFGGGYKNISVGDGGTPNSPHEESSFFPETGDSNFPKIGEEKPSEKNRSSSAAFVPELCGVDKLVFVSLILTQSHAITLYKHLPKHLGMQNMHLLYSMSNDGSDINTFYQKAKSKTHSVLVIQTVDGAEFGCFSASEWHSSESYYGNGENFLFSFTDTETMQVYKWTGIGTLFQFSNQEQVALGGGGEGFGILLKNDFDIVESLPCDTYGNKESLDKDNAITNTCSKVANVELWSFQLGF